MNTSAIRRSIKAFIRSYESELVDSLFFNQSVVKIGQILTVKGTLVRPGNRIVVGLEEVLSSEFYDTRMFGTSGSISYATIASKTAQTIYDMRLHVGAEVSIESGEVVGGTYEQFEKSAETFDTFCDRQADLFRKYTSIPPEDGSSWTIEIWGEYGERDREIRSIDQSGRLIDDRGIQYQSLYRIIEFQVKTCGEPRPLARS